MDFVVGIPKTLGKFDYIWVIVDRLTKSAHFILVKMTYNAEKLAKLYISKINRLHGVPLSIKSYRDLSRPNFSSHEGTYYNPSVGKPNHNRMLYILEAGPLTGFST